MSEGLCQAVGLLISSSSRHSTGSTSISATFVALAITFFELTSANDSLVVNE
jgi:hypothetical protein